MKAKTKPKRPHPLKVRGKEGNGLNDPIKANMASMAGLSALGVIPLTSSREVAESKKNVRKR